MFKNKVVVITGGAQGQNYLCLILIKAVPLLIFRPRVIG